MEILVGCDPEVFVKKGRSFVSADGLIPGTKQEPFKVDRGAYQVDGMALEFNTDPAHSEDEFVLNVQTVYAQLEAAVKERDPSLSLAVVPTAKFSPKVFMETSEASKELGCEPDFNAHRNGEQNQPPDNNTLMRTAAGHIHLGWTEGEDPRDPNHIMRCCTLVRHLDAYLGIPSLLWDGDKKRRSMYGRGGAFRAKPYGVEYRTLSNAWLTDERLMRYVYKQSVLCLERLMGGERFGNAQYDVIEDNINRSNILGAKSSLEKGFLNIFPKPPEVVS